ncbi:MAG: tRNA (adenosine(37)-N6)-threonylcarbamoyltransferase complex transferase subunit TsaD [Epsilonproteobacteria bacterium]|nr:tRNA (adenosine(37)-N6)-threonylcarbamoyltransferase complex transferase subunit TsaD [Campylobacterota bacterium]
MNLILSIESSCDDTSIALSDINSLKVVRELKLSQEKEHSQYGGVVPELASRLHAVAIPALIAKVKNYFPYIKAVAVTNRPGLSVTLQEGIIAAKALSAFLDVPIIGVNHLKGHIYSLFIEKKEKFPLIVLLLSGGHTQIIRVSSFNKMDILASTMDDSVGESFDKVAKMLGLGYPGGPIIEELAKDGDENRFNFPIPLRNSPKIAFSLSGLKNAVRIEIEKLKEKGELTLKDKRDIAASFQKALTLHLLDKTKKIIKKEEIRDFAIVGGVSANLYIKDKFKELLEKYNMNLLTPPLKWCMDNGAMIGRYAIASYKRAKFDKIETLEAIATKKGDPLA